MIFAETKKQKVWEYHGSKRSRKKKTIKSQFTKTHIEIALNTWFFSTLIYHKRNVNCCNLSLVKYCSIKKRHRKCAHRFKYTQTHTYIYTPIRIHLYSHFEYTIKALGNHIQIPRFRVLISIKKPTTTNPMDKQCLEYCC